MVGRPHGRAGELTELGVHDIIGIGFGPSNLALAIAVEEHNAQVPPSAALRTVFLERQEHFGWHRGMLLDGATMQVSYLKDLVTLRNPASDFSFVSYLHGRDRLVDFINHKTMFPLRHEFHDYLEWAAGRLDHLVEYGSEVVDLRPVTRGGEVAFVDVVSRRGGDPGQTEVRRARTVVIAVGLEPRAPEGVELGERIWHNHNLLDRIDAMPSMPRGRFLVVGAGQSAAEVTEHLHSRFSRAEVHAVFARYGYSPADDSSFANQIFDPAAVDDFFQAPDEVRAKLLDYHRSTNYSVVDTDLIDELYRRVYREKVQGGERLHIVRASQVSSLEQIPDGVRATVEFLPTGRRQIIDADVVVMATGYRTRDPWRILGGMAGLCQADECGRLRVQRDYQVVTTATTTAGLYVPGATEYAHGISSTLLSNIAVRAGEILRSTLDHASASAGTEGTPALALIR